jgi:hypothetical protein
MAGMLPPGAGLEASPKKVAEIDLLQGLPGPSAEGLISAPSLPPSGVRVVAVVLERRTVALLEF